METPLYQPFPRQGSGRGQIWRFAPQYRRPRHFHAEPELNLVCAGHGAFATGDRVIAVGAGDLVWWPAGIDHELVETSAHFDLFVVGLTPEFSERVLGRGSLAIAPGKVHCPPGDTFSRLHAACVVPVHELEPGALEQRVAELWREAHAAHTIATRLHPLARRSLLRVVADLELTRADLARGLGTHPSEVSRHFRRELGLTLTEYRTRLRLMRFIHAADAPGATLAAAAYAGGFGSYSQCHRAFHALFGCSPREFFEGSLRRELSEAFAPW